MNEFDVFEGYYNYLLNNNDMMLSSLPSKVLEFFNPKTKSLFLREFNYRRINDGEAEHSISITLYEKIIRSQYKNINIDVNPGIQPVIREPIRNCLFHGGNGNENETFKVSLGINSQKMITGFCDYGKFFGKTDVKKYFEAKEKHPDTDSWPKDKQSQGQGIEEFIYKRSHFIHVDTNSKTLWLGFDVNNKEFPLFYNK